MMCGLPTPLQVNECLSTGMQIYTFKGNRSGSLLTMVDMTEQKTTNSSQDPIAANRAAFS